MANKQSFIKNRIKIHEKNKTKAKVKGKKIFQPIYINWSNLNRGKFDRTNIKVKAIKIDFILKNKSKPTIV